MVVHPYNLSIWEAEDEQEFEGGLGYIDPVHNKQTEKHIGCYILSNILLYIFDKPQHIMQLS